MSTDARLERFTDEQPRLLGLAYRMLGSRADAEDVVQEAWLRYGAAAEEPSNVAAWLTTVTTRLSLDRLRSAARRRERYVGPWLPEPVRTDLAGGPTPVGPTDPGEAVDRAETLTLGVLVVLDTLSPEDRAVFLLADVFGVPFGEVAEIVGRSPDACRQAASRARRRLRAATPPARPPTDRSGDLAARLAAAVASGDLGATLALLAPGVVLVSDGGPSQHAARRPVIGADKVSRFMVNAAKRLPPETEIELAELNGARSVILRISGAPITVLTVDADDHGKVTTVRMVLAPEKLAALDTGIVT